MWRFRTFLAGALGLFYVAHPTSALAEAGGVPAQIAALQTAVQAQSVELKGLQTSVTALQTTNATLQAAVASIQSAIAALQGQVSQLQAKDGQHDAAITSLNGQIAALQSRLSTVLDQSCPAGQFAHGITSAGSLSCAQPADQKQFVRHAYVSFIGIPDDYLYHTVAQLNLSAGKHVIHFNGLVHGGAAENVYLECQMFAVHNLQSDLIADLRIIEYDSQEVPVPILARADLATSGAILVKCRVAPGHDNAYFFNTQMVGWPVDDFL